MNHNEELDSQLSAMFDDELPEEECELLARRLARDEALRARWGRYAIVGACIRGESGVRLPGGVAPRVSAAVSGEPGLSGAGLRRGMPLGWLQGLAGAATAAGVAALAIAWMRSQSTVQLAQVPVPEPVSAALSSPAAAPAPVVAAPAPVLGAVAARAGGASEPDSYVVPTGVQQSAALAPAEVADYIVAHSEYSTPLIRGAVLSALVAGEPLAVASAPRQAGAQDAQGAQ
ncbi:MAG TPA: sigma-E factor negative regulatory protein [Steroidobacteraceae bacterium]|nr:sigma-E factor negative regulatory protein [Steroidobacteraceae bacterium]